MIGEEGICERCGAIGEWCYDPYDQEIYDELNEVCLCDKCYQDMCWEI